MNKIEFTKMMIDEAREQGLNNVANFWCDELRKHQTDAMVGNED
jgi:hypothetical protein